MFDVVSGSLRTLSKATVVRTRGHVPILDSGGICVALADGTR